MVAESLICKEKTADKCELKKAAKQAKPFVDCHRDGWDGIQIIEDLNKTGCDISKLVRIIKRKKHWL